MTSRSILRNPSHEPRRAFRALTVVVGATVLVTACTPVPADQPTSAGSGQSSAAETASATGPTASAAPSTGTVFFAGSANVSATVTIAPGWEVVANAFVLKSGDDPAIGVAFIDVANLYADGCRWTLVKPPLGPTVDDLVSAYGKVADLGATAARPVTVDGFRGKQLQFTVPGYRAADCQDNTFALAQADNAGTNTAQGGAPNYWALAPNQQNQALILDVDGARLVIFTGHPPDISAQDRADLDAIVASLQIG